MSIRDLSDHDRARFHLSARGDPDPIVVEPHSLDRDEIDSVLESVYLALLLVELELKFELHGDPLRGRDVPILYLFGAPTNASGVR